MIDRFFFIGPLLLFLTGCGVVLSKNEYGVQDDTAARAIERANMTAALRDSLDFKALRDQLVRDRAAYQGNAYANTRINAELSEIYSHHLLDIESAIEIDQKLLSAPIVDVEPTGAFVPKYLVASQRIVANKEHLASYINIPTSRILDETRTRHSINVRLLQGERPTRNSSYDLAYLKRHHQTVTSDVDSTIAGSADRHRILSRLIRSEYELLRLETSFRPVAYEYVLKSELPIERIDLTEIDFLSLADYFTLVYKKIGDVRLAEYALDTVYRPYVNLRSADARWKYNKLINDYISTLIDANYKLNRYDDMLYYASLNKSRMLLEERLAFGEGRNANARLAEIAVNDGIPRNQYGLPDKTWFAQKLATTDRFLDIYVGGAYVRKPSGSRAAAVKHIANANTMPLSKRNAGVIAESDDDEWFDDDVMYVTYIEKGKVSVKQVAGKALDELKAQLDKVYSVIASDTDKSPTPTTALKTITDTFDLPAELTVSTDKWFSKHPLDYLLNARTVRSVNFFTASKHGKLGAVRIAGLFNPTLADGQGNLPGAELEANIIKALDSSAIVIKNEDANLVSLAKAAGANIVHLSMHGSFDPASPQRSKLYFAGAKFARSSEDPKALYAEDMGKYEAFRDRDVVFAAACETGLSKADATNVSEQTGMIRPLTANRNRNVILSLWSVSDAATKDFVTAFYERLLVTKDVTISFRHAQDEVRKKYPHPKYWAAFYLSQS